MTEPLTPGLHRIPMADYLADPCPVPSLSSGCAFRLISECPQSGYHYHPRLGGRKTDDSNASNMGTTAHDFLLGGEKKICEIKPEEHRSKPTKDNPEGAIPKGWTNDAIRAARDTAVLNGLTPMLSAEMAGARAMAKAAREFIASSEIAGVFDEGESELTAIAREGDTWLRTRPDWLNLSMGISLSYKTTRLKVRPDQFHRAIDSMGYGFSLMFYERCLLGALPGMTRPRSVILAQEQFAPHLCSLIELSPAKADIERSQVDRAIRLWTRCMETNVWPAYGSRIVQIEPRPWDLAAEEQRLMEDEMEAMQ